MSLEDALRELYAVAPDAFMAKRTELVAAAKAAGDTEGAQTLGKARKPTVAAWVVNALVLQDPSVTDQLRDLGDRLRAAQGRLDAGELRALSGERNRLVSQLCRRALELSGRRDPPAALNDDVRGTFDAALADPDVAQRLGRLQHAEQWSGFGFGPGGSPELTLLPGGGAGTPRKAPAKETAAQRRRRTRLLEAAQEAFDRADAEVADLERGIASEEQRVADLEREFARARGELDSAKGQLGRSRRDLTRLKKRRQQARRELDKAERGAE